MNEPVVSVIIVNYNAGPLLGRCVQSVLQSGVSLEVIVSDNGSSDESLPLLRYRCGSPANLSILHNRENLGFARANNLAVAQASAGLLLFLNPDCLLESYTLEQMLAVMEARPDAGMAGCRILNPDGSEQRGGRRNLPTPGNSLPGFIRKPFGIKPFNLNDEPLPDSVVEVPAISGSFMLVRRAAMEQVGLMDEDYFLHCEDLDWCARFSKKGYPILFVPQVAITHYQGSCSRRRPLFVQWHLHRGMRLFFDKHYRHVYAWPVRVATRAGIWGRFSLKALQTIFGRR